MLIPFAEYLGVFHARSDPHKVTALLKAYLDESGTHVGSPVVIVGGFVAAGGAWVAADEKWRSALRSFDIDHFHMNECEKGTGQFAKWAASPEKRRAVAVTMTEIVRDAGLFGYWAAIGGDDWQAENTVELTKKHPRPYYLCFERCLREIAAWSAGFMAAAPVAVVMAEQNEYEELANGIYAAYRAAKDWTELASLAFAPMRSCAPLQAADLLVYCANKQFDQGVNSVETEHRIYQVFWDRISEGEIPVCGTHLDRFSLQEIKANLVRGGK